MDKTYEVEFIFHKLGFLKLKREYKTPNLKPSPINSHRIYKIIMPKKKLKKQLKNL